MARCKLTLTRDDFIKLHKLVDTGRKEVRVPRKAVFDLLVDYSRLLAQITNDPVYEIITPEQQTRRPIVKQKTTRKKPLEKRPIRKRLQPKLERKRLWKNDPSDE